MSATTTPTPEQVAERTLLLAQDYAVACTDPEDALAINAAYDALRAGILSALSTAESEIQQCRETLRLKPSEGLTDAVTRLTLQVESAEARLALVGEALDDYGDHLRYCHNRDDDVGRTPCDCGFKSTMKRIDAARNQEGV